MNLRSLHPARCAVITIAITVALASCGAPRANPFSATRSPAAGNTGEAAFSTHISREEILDRGNTLRNGYFLIQRLRPTWLLPRGQNSMADPAASYPLVYFDAVRHGTLVTLHQIAVTEIQRVEFVSAADATTRWGTGHRAGVINVVIGRR